MKRKLVRAVLWLLLAGCVVTAPTFLPQTAYALSGVAAITTYYSDATHKTVVGTTTVFCDGTVSTTGQVTAFHTTRIVECAPE
jgi:hypothetical protein